MNLIIMKSLVLSILRFCLRFCPSIFLQPQFRIGVNQKVYYWTKVEFHIRREFKWLYHSTAEGMANSRLLSTCPSLKRGSKNPITPINIIRGALRVKEFMVAHPDETCLSATAKLNLHRKRISKLLTIANQLPANLIEELANCHDPKTLHQMNVKHLLELAKER